MFTYKFVGLDKPDAETPYYYGSLPAKPVVGTTLLFHGTGNRYVIIGIDGKGLTGGDPAADRNELAWADINRGEKVPTLHLRKLGTKLVPHDDTEFLTLNFKTRVAELPVIGESREYEEMKARTQGNKKKRLKKPKKRLSE